MSSVSGRFCCGSGLPFSRAPCSRPWPETASGTSPGLHFLFRGALRHVFCFSVGRRAFGAVFAPPVGRRGDHVRRVASLGRMDRGLPLIERSCSSAFPQWDRSYIGRVGVASRRGPFPRQGRFLRLCLCARTGASSSSSFFFTADAAGSGDDAPLWGFLGRRRSPSPIFRSLRRSGHPKGILSQPRLALWAAPSFAARHVSLHSSGEQGRARLVKGWSIRFFTAGALGWALSHPLDGTDLGGSYVGADVFLGWAFHLHRHRRTHPFCRWRFCNWRESSALYLYAAPLLGARAERGWPSQWTTGQMVITGSVLLGSFRGLVGALAEGGASPSS
jgi:hypothetical protein